MEFITGKIAAIKSDYAVVINKGYADGVEEDMRFIVFEEGEEINDPDTKESLGKLEYVKAKVKVTYPSERLSWAETYETYAIPGTLAAIDSAVAAISGFVPRYERVKLPLDKTPSSSVSGPVTMNLKIGDLVRQIID
jgi:hypothetical protein